MAEPKGGEKSSAEQSPEDLINQLLGGGGIDLSSLAADQQAEQQVSLDEVLAQAAVEVSGVDLFDYSDSALPAWFPDSLRKYATNENLHGVYDPYLGMVSQKGDERVFMNTGKAKLNGKVFIGDMTGWGVEDFLDRAHDKQRNATKAEKDRGDVAFGNQANKVEAQMGNDPGEQRTKHSKKLITVREDSMSYQQAQNLPYVWSEKEVNHAMKKMRAAGANVTTFDQMTQVWGSLVDRASNMYSLSQGKRKVTPWDVLEISKREAVNAGNFTNFENGTETRTARSVAEVSEGASWQVLQQTLAQLLGRDPTDQELRDYTYRMNNLASKNPSITETITHYKAGEAVSSNSTTTGGFDAGDMAQHAYEEAQDDPDYGVYQAGTTYFNAAIDALGAIGGN